MARRSRERGWPTDPEPLPGPVYDNHTHLDFIRAVERPKAEAAPGDDEWMYAERECRVWPGFATGDVPTPAQHVARAAAVGVVGMVQVGCELPAARWTDKLLRDPDPATHNAFLGAVAIHPNEATLHAGIDEVGPDGLTPRPAAHHDVGLDDAIAEIADLARGNDRIRAIGETGMDLFRTGPRGAQAQRESFRAHIALAKELGLALQIHDRDAHREVMDVLIADGAPERTVFHCFSGDAQMAQECAKRGWYLSYAGPVTFKANHALRDALRVTPPSRILVETDAPFLTPDPFRGRPNAPFVLPLTIRAVSNITGQGLAEVCSLVTANTNTVYGTW